jgi:tRNA 2-selenouridine synthase
VPLVSIAAADAIERLDDFSAIVDARSESEYALDRLPGAVNWPTLNEAERASVGAEYKQVSPFTARKRGAILAARNIAAHVERHVLELPREWSPLVYCWRGGQRSGSLGLVLGQIGFRVHVLEGGYRAFRKAVVEALDALPATLSFVVVGGVTGSGKSLLLRALAARGEQVLDLEALANHRGSVLGLAPGEAQPSQKAFDTAVWNALRRFDPARPVFVESESAKVGDLRVPPALLARMRAAPCVWLELPDDARVALLLREYDFFVRDVDAFCARLDALRVLRGHETVNAWQEAARGGRIESVVRDLLVMHYDPIYLQSIRRNFPATAAPLARIAWDGSAAALSSAADAAAHSALTRAGSATR